MTLPCYWRDKILVKGWLLIWVLSGIRIFDSAVLLKGQNPCKRMINRMSIKRDKNIWLCCDIEGTNHWKRMIIGMSIKWDKNIWLCCVIEGTKPEPIYGGIGIIFSHVDYFNYEKQPFQLYIMFDMYVSFNYTRIVKKII